MALVVIMDEYEVLIDTQLEYGIITITVVANNEKEAHDKAVNICKEMYKEDYEYDRNYTYNKLSKYKRLYKKQHNNRKY